MTFQAQQVSGMVELKIRSVKVAWPAIESSFYPTSGAALIGGASILTWLYKANVAGVD